MMQPTITRYNLAAQILVSLHVNNVKYTAEQLAAKALDQSDVFFKILNDRAKDNAHS